MSDVDPLSGAYCKVHDIYCCPKCSPSHRDHVIFCHAMTGLLVTVAVNPYEPVHWYAAKELFYPIVVN
jgi:hypothetical protein